MYFVHHIVQGITYNILELCSLIEKHSERFIFYLERQRLLGVRQLTPALVQAAALWSPTYLESEYFNDGIYGYWWYVIVGWRGSWSRNQRSQI